MTSRASQSRRERGRWETHSSGHTSTRRDRSRAQEQREWLRGNRENFNVKSTPTTTTPSHDWRACATLSRNTKLDRLWRLSRGERGRTGCGRSATRLVTPLSRTASPLSRGAEIEQITLQIGEVLGAPADLARVRAAFDAIRRRERELPGPERFRTPVVVWNAVNPAIGDFVSGPLPEIALDVDAARTFERPHGRWSPYVRGNLVPARDPRARPFVFLESRSRDPSVPRWLVEAEALRYGIPGHALLDSFRRAATGVPDILRTQEREAFEGGWGLYAARETLAEDLIEFDDGGFGVLAQELAAFLALSVDLGIHDRGWSYSQALDTVTEWTPLPEIAAREIVLRAISEPGRSALPAIGLLRMRTLRTAIEGVLGSAFDAPQFHRAIVEGGPLPMRELDGRIERWLQEARAAESSQ